MECKAPPKMPYYDNKIISHGTAIFISRVMYSSNDFPLHRSVQTTQIARLDPRLKDTRLF